MPIALCFSSSKWRRRWETGFVVGRMFKECSATSRGMPGMLEGFHAKKSWLARRKSTSVLSYSLESVVPTRIFLVGSVGSSSISFASSAVSKALHPALDLLGVG